MDIAIGPCAAIKVGWRVGACGCLNRDAVAGQQSTERCTGDIATAGGDGEIHRVNQPCAGQPRSCSGGDFGIVRDLDVGGAGFNKTTVAPIRRRGVQRATHIRGARRHAPQQGDAALMVLHRARFDHAGVVHHAGEQRVFGACAHDDYPAVGADQSAVFGKAVEHALVNLHLHQAVVLEGEGGGIACPQRHRALRRGDRALVTNSVAKQGYIAAGAA